MSTKARIGISIAVVSIVFCALCFAVYFAFTPVVLVSALVVIPAVLAICIAAWTSIDYSLKKRAQLRIAT